MEEEAKLRIFLNSALDKRARANWLKLQCFSLVDEVIRFESRPGHGLTWLRFLVSFLRPSGQMPGSYLKLGYEHFLPHPFQFIFH
jgi:hypothetical protein